jgi:general nucleoside transport system permease protein
VAAPEGAEGMTALAARFGGVRWTHPRTVGVFGILLGALAFWLTLPPKHIRATPLPVALGIVAIAAGIWAWSRDERRVGGGAIASGLLGIALGLLAIQSSVSHLNDVVVWSALGAATLRYATPLVYAAIGGLYCERSGVINVALEGMLLTGAFFGIWGAIWAHSWAGNSAWIFGLFAAAVAGMVMAAIHAVWAIHLRVDQIISGTAINFLALGITGFLFIDKYGDTGTPGNVPDYGIPDIHIHFIRHLPLIGHFLDGVVGQLNLMIWLSFALLVATYVFVFRTPYGLRLRAVGEHPRAADTVGISVFKIRYMAVIGSGAIAAMGGAYLSIGFVHSFNEGMTNGTGFIGLAALVFGKWRPFTTWGATLLFGFSSALADRLPDAYGNQWGTLFSALPYVLTLVAVAGVIGRSIGPAAAGRPYVKQ